MKYIVSIVFLIGCHFLAKAQTPKTAFQQTYDHAVQLQKDGEYHTAMAAFEQAIELARGDSLLIAECLNSMAALSKRLGNWAEAITYGQQALSVFKRSGNSTANATAHYTLGNVYREIGDFTNAIKHLLKAALLFEKTQDSVNLSRTYNLLGLTYRELNEFRRSIEYHERALYIRKQINDSASISVSLNNLGETYREMEFMDSAVYCYVQALKIASMANDSVVSSAAYYNLAQVELQAGHFKKAELYLQEALRLRLGLKDVAKIAYTHNLLGRAAALQHHYASAGHNLDSAAALAEKANIKELLLENYLYQRDLAVQLNNLTDVVFYTDQYIDLYKEVFKEEKLRAQQQLEVEFDVERKTQENLQLKKDKEIKHLEWEAEHNRSTIFRSWLVAAVFALAFLILLALILSRKAIIRRRQAERERQNKREMHHRLQNNLQMLSGLCGRQLRFYNDTACSTPLKKLRGQVRAMTWVHEYLNIPESTRSTFSNIDEYVRKLARNVAHGNGIPNDCFTLDLDIEPIELEAEKAQTIGLIMNEMLTNSFKHALIPGKLLKVRICLKRVRKDHVLLEYVDNGPGLPDDLAMDELTSTGMRLINDLSRELGGHCSFNSSEGKGVQMTIEFENKKKGTEFISAREMAMN